VSAEGGVGPAAATGLTPAVAHQPGPVRPIRVLIVDDHTLLREGLRDILEAEEDITVVGEAGNGREALRCVMADHPDVVVLDVGIPGDDVTVTVSAIRRASPGADILILSIYDDAAVVRELLSMGVRGYLLKSVTRQDFLTAVRGVRRDPQMVVLSISRQTLQQVNGAGTLLSQREREIMAMVADAMSNSQIARRLSIAEGTVKRHLRNIFAKLGAVSRIDAVNKAIITQELPPLRRGGDYQR
jgi:DNA-binding NarL/FixJ family response regulator